LTLNTFHEPNWAIIHIYVEVSQGNSLCGYLKQPKMSYFFSFSKLENWKADWVLPEGGGLVSMGRGAGGERV
jgi:hypothetical protein